LCHKVDTNFPTVVFLHILFMQGLRDSGGWMRYVIVSFAIFLSVGLALSVHALQPPATAQLSGNALFDRSCATCHKAGEKEIPAPELLRTMTPEAIVNALTIGKMSTQGASLSAAERAAVAQFLTGRAPVLVANQTSNRCTAPTPTLDPARGPSWMNWGNDASNSRFVPRGGL